MDFFKKIELAKVAMGLRLVGFEPTSLFSGRIFRPMACAVACTKQTPTKASDDKKIKEHYVE